MEHCESDKTLVSLAIEQWKLLRLYRRSIIDLPLEKQKRTEAQWAYASGRLVALAAELRLRLMEYEGMAYEPNLPVIVLNADEFDTSEGLVIDRTLEPTVLRDGQVLSMGTVVVTLGEETNVSGD